MTDLDASTEHMRFSCGSVAGLGSCSEGFTAQADVKDWSSYANLGTLSIVCPQEGSGMEQKPQATAAIARM